MPPESGGVIPLRATFGSSRASLIGKYMKALLVTFAVILVFVAFMVPNHVEVAGPNPEDVAGQSATGL